MFEPKLLATQIADLPADSFPWGAIKWLCNARLLPGAMQTLGLCHILPGCANPLHYHPNCEELLYMLAGRGKHRLGDDWLNVEPGTTVRIPQGMQHQLVNDGWEPISCVVVFSTGDRQTVFVEVSSDPL